MAESETVTAPHATHERILHPKPGDEVYFHHWTHDWIPAKVVDRVAAEDNDGAEMKYPPARMGTCHLRIALDPERHFCGEYTTFGYRQHVAEGTDVSQWQRVPPEGWREAKAEYEQRKAMQREARLEFMRESAGGA